MSEILVVGVGNPLLRDEGIGIHVINRLRETGLPPGVDLVDGGTNSYDLVDFFCQAPKLIIIDAMKAGGNPGTIYRAPLEELGLKAEENVVSIHQMHFVEAMHFVNLLGYHPQTLVFGIEPGIIDWGQDLSPELERVLPRVVELIRQEIDTMLVSE